MIMTSSMINYAQCRMTKRMIMEADRKVLHSIKRLMPVLQITWTARPASNRVSHTGSTQKRLIGS